MSRPSSNFTISIIGAGVAGPVLALTILSNPTLRDLYTPILYDKLPSPEDHQIPQIRAVNYPTQQEPP